MRDVSNSVKDTLVLSVFTGGERFWLYVNGKEMNSQLIQLSEKFLGKFKILPEE